MSLSWKPPNIGARPLALLGAGVLGRRIAGVFAAAGYNVNLRDPSEEARKGALDYLHRDIHKFAGIANTGRPFGKCNAYADSQSAVKDAWLVIEAVPERLQLKIDTMADLDSKAPADCILASNSSSFKSRLMLEKLKAERRKLVCNMHYSMPPEIRTVELMTDGETYPEVFPFLTNVLEDVGLLPVTARKESTGFIFNRLWAAIKREIVTILAEGVSEPKEIDRLWLEMFKPGSKAPCAMMDEVGLDTVAFIEDNYVQERHLDPTLTTQWLRKNYIEKGKLGEKSGKGGLFPPQSSIKSDGVNPSPTAFFLDVGLGSNVRDISKAGQSGRIIRRSADGQMTTLVSGQSCPDGIDISRSTGRMFWTNMGPKTSTHDGSVWSADLDGSNVREIIPKGAVHTPKQLAVDEINKKVYFCDREGLGVHRCDFDGANHEVIVLRGDCTTQDKLDQTRWCVGIAIDAMHGRFYWTQKGTSKGNEGRIFRANMEMPAGEDASNRSDIELVLEGLPEPIDLEIDPEAETLYWTDRGEHPFGSSLNKACLRAGKPETQILARHFNEPIGLKLDTANGIIYVTDLGGGLYRCDLDGSKTVLERDDGCYSGITLM